MTVKRIQYHQYGGPEVMRLEDFDPAPPGTGEVLVRVRAAGANPMDFGIRAGRMKMVTGRSFPRAMGYDFAGVVEAVGDRVTRLHVGDEVLGGATMKSAGAFADMIVTQEKLVVKKPANLSFEDAATLPTVGATALQALLTKGNLRPGQAVFVHSCLGGVGRSAVQIALAHQATVAGSCRDTARSEARALGVDPVVDFDVDPASLAGRFDLVLDAGGKHSLPVKAARTMLKPGGHIVSIAPTPANFVRSFLPGPYKVLVTQPVTEDLEEVTRAAGEGTLRLPIARTVPLSQAIPALTELEQGGAAKRGKLIITPG
ncbi:NADP-dependent oxidoreductase [Streptomyces sp. NPDC020983]|uniref:NADP-dependent oxidoreductase n=1 Tax=Streptomyces sp. NPDC020983 TaxID=3365106 RepID=UPI0037AC0F7C